MAAYSRNLLPLPSSPLSNRCPQCLHVRYKLSRHYSPTPSRSAMTIVQPDPQDLVKRMESRKSRKVQMKAMSGSKVPDDVGLIPQTFIRPPSREMPRLFGSKWKSRLKLEWLWVWTRVQNFGGLLWFLPWSQRKLPKSERMPLNLQSRPSIALALHKNFYTFLAVADYPSLRNILCTGLANKSQSRIKHHLDNKLPPHSWNLIRYTGPLNLPFSSRLLPYPLTSLLPSQAKIVSDRVAPFPMGKNVYVRQCVVRIRTLQSLDKKDGNPPSPADLTEYVVMQQMNKEGEPIAWKLWGTTKPTTKEEMEKLAKGGSSEGKMTLLDRMRTADPTRGF